MLLGNAVTQALKRLQQPAVKGFWIHLDADVLDDAIMPAVDYRMPEGLSFAELIEVLQLLMASPKVIGMNVTIFNPKLDRQRNIFRFSFLTAFIEWSGVAQSAAAKCAIWSACAFTNDGRAVARST